MNRSKLTICLIVLTICSMGFHGTLLNADDRFNHMLVANRSSGSISQINLSDNSVQNFALPTATNPSEPMYITYSPDNELVYVGDRANNRLVIYNPTDLAHSKLFLRIAFARA